MLSTPSPTRRADCPSDTDAIAGRLALARTIAREAGDFLLGFRRDRLDVAVKGAQDFVTQADLAVERMIRNAIAQRFPDDQVLGEEGGGVEAPRLWVIDPIDGTINFIRGLPAYAVSIAYVENGSVMVGVVQIPMLAETFHARRGGGAYCNDRPIRASECASLKSARIAAGYAQRGSKAVHLRVLAQLMREGSDVLKFNSAAVCLAMTAAGRIDGYFERELRSWDVLAGQLLVSEAGGWVNEFGAGTSLLALDHSIACGRPLTDALRAVAGV